MGNSTTSGAGSQVLPTLEDPEERRYYERLDALARLALA
jgi:hypothetical protein